MLGPFRTRPIFKGKPWAGDRLAGLVEGAPPGTGEVWLVSDLDGEASPIASGAHSGRTLRDLVREHPLELLGAAFAAEERFPLLVKVLDVGAPLSLQLHPDAALARALGDGPRGKAETWLVLEPGAEARVDLGLAGPTPADEVVRLARDGGLVERLASFVPEPGEPIEIPPGTLHSAREVLLLEVQEPSDVTYRVHDWGRNGRELHLEQTRRVLAALEPSRLPRAGGGWVRGRRALAQLSPFHFDALDLRAGARLTLPGGAPQVLVVLEGRAVIEAAGHPLLLVERGEAAVLPAALPEVSLQAPTWVRAGLAAPRQPQGPAHAGNGAG